MKPLIVTAIGALFGICGCAAKTPIRVNTVHDLYGACTSSAVTYQAYCKGVIDAVFLMHSNVGEPDALSLCTSVEGTSYERMLRAVVDWHNAHQEHWNDAAVRGVAEALHSVFPCPR